jgi:hypothetical protein
MNDPELTVGNKSFNIIITIPHAVSLDGDKRTSDRSAVAMGLMISSYLGQKGHHVHIIKSSQNRYLLDDNRYSSKYGKTIKKDSPLWTELRNLVNTLDHAKTIIIDCHSFYKGGLGGSIDNPLIILDYTPYQSINMFLEKNINSIKILEGAIGRNSIMDVFTLHPSPIPVVLLETLETLDRKELDVLAQEFANALDRYIDQYAYQTVYQINKKMYIKNK